MRQVLVNTPAGLVLRLIRSNGEEAWRYNHDGTVDHCHDHKGPWVTVNWCDVPVEVRTQLNDARRAGNG